MSTTAPETAVVALAMSSRQLIRRARIIDTVLELIGDVGAENVQMREVARQAGVALATAYGYFHSKEHLLAAALEDWQERLSRRILSASGSSGRDPQSKVLEFLRRAQRAFYRNPEMTKLMMQMMGSGDAEVGATIDRMNRTNAAMFEHLLEGYPPDVIPNLSFALNAALTSAVAWLLTGMMSLEQSIERVDWTARTLLGQYSATISANDPT